MKKTVSLIMAVCMLLCLAGCGEKKTDTSLTDIVARGTMRVGVVATQSDHISLETLKGTYSGLEADLTESIGRGIGVGVTYIDIDLKDVPTLLANKDIDIAIGNIAQADGTETGCAVSTYYAQGYLYVATLDDYYGDTFGAFENMAVGTSDALSSLYKSNVLAHTQNVKSYMDAKSAISAIEDGEIAAYFCYESQAKEMLQGENIRVRNLIGTDPEKYVIVTAPASVELLNGVNMIIPLFLQDRENPDVSENEQGKEE